MSCATGAGIEQLKLALFRLCPAGVRPGGRRRAAGAPEFLDYRPVPPRRRTYRVLRTERGYRVAGDPPEGDALDAVLREAGVRKGAIVEIGDEEFEWQP